MSYLNENEIKLLQEEIKKDYNSYWSFTKDSTFEEIRPLYNTLFPPKEANDIIAGKAVYDFETAFKTLPDLNNIEHQKFLAIQIKLYTNSLSGIAKWEEKDVQDFLHQKFNQVEEMGSSVKNVFPNKTFIKFLYGKAQKVGHFLYDYWEFRKIDESFINEINNSHPKLLKEFAKANPSAFTIEAVNRLGQLNIINNDELCKRINFIKNEQQEVKDFLKAQGADIKIIEAMSAENLEATKLLYQGMDSIWSEIKTQKEQAKIKENFDAIANGGNLISQIGQMTGDKTMMQVGGTIAASTQAIFAYSQLTGAFGVAQIGGLAALNPFTAMIGGILTIASILGSNDDENGLQETFQQLFNTLDTIYKDMKNEFKQVHREISELYELMKKSYDQDRNDFIKLFTDLDKISEFQKFSFTHLKDAVDAVRLNNLKKIINDVAKDYVKDFNSQDNFKYLTELSFGSSEVARDKVFTAWHLPTKDAMHNPDIANNLEHKSFDQNIGFLVNYAGQILNIKNLPSGDRVANPLLYLDIVKYIPKLSNILATHDKSHINSIKKILETASNTGRDLNQALYQLKAQNVIQTIKDLYLKELQDLAKSFETNLKIVQSDYKWPVSPIYDINTAANSVAKSDNLGSHITHKEYGCTVHPQMHHYCHNNRIPEGQASNVMNVNYYHLAQSSGLGDFFIGKSRNTHYGDVGSWFHINHYQLGFNFNHQDIALSELIEMSGYVKEVHRYGVNLTGRNINGNWDDHKKIEKNFVDNALANKLNNNFADMRNKFFNKYLDGNGATCKFKVDAVKPLFVYEMMINHYTSLLSQAKPQSFLKSLETHLCNQKSKGINDNLSLDIVDYFNKNYQWPQTMDHDSAYYTMTKSVISNLEATNLSLLSYLEELEKDKIKAEKAKEFASKKQEAGKEYCENILVYNQLCSYNNYIEKNAAKICKKTLLQISDSGTEQMLLEQGNNGAITIRSASGETSRNQEASDLLTKFIGIFNNIKSKIDHIKESANYKTNDLIDLFKDLNCMDTFLHENKEDFDYHGDKRYNDISKKITQIVGENKYVGDQVYCDNFIESLA
jgi:hypothetical protein